MPAVAAQAAAAQVVAAAQAVAAQGRLLGWWLPVEHSEGDGPSGC